MRALLNTLYITTQRGYLKKDGETVLVSVEHRIRLRVPIHTLSGIVCFGKVGCSPPLMDLCGERQSDSRFLPEHGRFWRGSKGSPKGTCCCGASSTAAPTRMPRRRKWPAAVMGKMANSRQILQGQSRARREGPIRGFGSRGGDLAGQLKPVETMDLRRASRSGRRCGPDLF